MAFLETMGLLIGLILLVWVSFQLSTLIFSSCWEAVNKPFKTLFTDSTAPGKLISVKLDSACLDKLVITRDIDKCFETCGTEKDCSENCRGTGKVFFITQRKKDDSSMMQKTVSWVAKPVEMAKKNWLEHSQVYVAICNLDKETIECRPQETSKIVDIYIDGDYRGLCSIKDKKDGQKLPAQCRIVA